MTLVIIMFNGIKNSFFSMGQRYKIWRSRKEKQKAQKRRMRKRRRE